jgi:hypothetical protein
LVTVSGETVTGAVVSSPMGLTPAPRPTTVAAFRLPDTAMTDAARAPTDAQLRELYDYFVRPEQPEDRALMRVSKR